MYNVRAMTEKRRWKKQVLVPDVIIQLAMQGGSPELERFCLKIQQNLSSFLENVLGAR